MAWEFWPAAGLVKLPGRALGRRVHHDEVPDVRRDTDRQACARGEAISAPIGMAAARMGAGKAAIDPNEIPQRPAELVGRIRCAVPRCGVGSAPYIPEQE